MQFVVYWLIVYPPVLRNAMHEMSGGISWRVKAPCGGESQRTGKKLLEVSVFSTSNIKNYLLTPIDLPQGFLVYFESELLKRAHKNFDFRNGRSAKLQVAWVGFLINYLFQYWKLLSCCGSRVLQIVVFSHIPLFVYHEQSGEFCKKAF